MIVSDLNNSCLSGHNWVWAQSCLGTIVWAQSCMGTHVVEPVERVAVGACGVVKPAYGVTVCMEPCACSNHMSELW